MSLSAALVAALSTYFQARQETKELRSELQRRSAALAESLKESLEPALIQTDAKEMLRVLRRNAARERLLGAGIFDAQARTVAATAGTERRLKSLESLLKRAAGLESPPPPVSRRGFWGEEMVFVYPLAAERGPAGSLLLIHDTSYIQSQIRLLWRHNFFRLLFHALVILLVSLWVIRWNIMAPIDHLAEWMKQVRTGQAPRDLSPPAGLLEPVAKEAVHLAQSLTAARAAAEEEARLRQEVQSVWTAERLKEHVRAKLEGRPLFVVANREPYMHERRGKRLEVVTPASGLVTGVEPVLLACGGTWVGQGAGDADRETADERGRVRVPPDEPKYTLKRVWLSKEEEEGYYYGFSNEGLWPLCHIAHTRPIFRSEDWKQYQDVNRKFADALLEELDPIQEPCVLIQDYHFALLPRLIKEARPDARVAIFWHIPWPNPEAFGICPWQREILDGMLGADLVGFHIQYHCNNFLETVDRALECRIEWERFAVHRRGHVTTVKPFPISIALPEPVPSRGAAPGKETLLKGLGVKARWMGVGVDRVDYTKGIIERFRAIERFLEKNPVYQGEFVFVEIGAPSRTHIKSYQDLEADVEAEAERINRRFSAKDYRPIVLLKKHHSHKEIDPYYRAADLCMVTSLHDGMNLVAKEFVAAREDEQGVLILSHFTGAARELRDALVVNPYDTERTAQAIKTALEMDPEERARRMLSMRRILKEYNVYFWAGRLIEDLTAIRLPASAGQKTS
ncbi:MAG: trehalose-6-phosphate synthase [Elusimicrobia bacterium]|nr:trehalose-6-phosphate synthase [Elusimicrobiota bacterium]